MTDKELQVFQLPAAEQHITSEIITREDLAEFTELYRNSYKRCIMKAKDFRVNEPEVTTQNAFEKALRYWNSYTDNGYSREVWLRRIVSNLALSEINRATIRGNIAQIELSSGEPHYDNHIDTNTSNIIDNLAMEQYMDHIAAVLKDNPKWFEIFKLVLEGYSRDEISQHLGIPAATVNSGLNRARKLLKSDATIRTLLGKD